MEALGAVQRAAYPAIRRLLAVLAALAAFAALALLSRVALAGAPPARDECGDAGACGLDDPAAAAPAQPDDASAPLTLLFFWGVGCPHCREAEPLVRAVEDENPRLHVEAIEVRQDPEGRRRFVDTMRRLGAASVGVPTFVIGEHYLVGYAEGDTDVRLRAMIAEALGTSAPARERIAVPFLGEVDPITVSLPAFTVAIGLADSVNPCAIWVLVVLLGILLHVDTTRRMALYAGTFVAMSGVVYFGFMVAWSAFFELVGISRLVTKVLGAALLVMGLVNLKDVLWFKKGVSFVIPERAKPGLFRRMRAIARAATTPAALGGIAVLAFVVNLVELGCTLGFPAIYTRVLALRHVATAPRLAYLVLYNVVYVIPLFVIAVVFIGFKRRIAMTELAGRALKGVSGLLLVVFGLVFVFAPRLLGG
ncbi:MAG TPA: thioredoxin family protein [Minicystis sp.]|nr:thioredoxin family protein [Minicystis sp.]